MRWRFARRLVRCWPACRRELRDLRGAVPRPREARSPRCPAAVSAAGQHPVTLNQPAWPTSPTGPRRCRRARWRAPSPRSPASTTSTAPSSSPRLTTWSSASSPATWTTPPRSCTTTTAGDSTSRNVLRPPTASRRPGSPGPAGPTPTITCAPRTDSTGCCAQPAAAAPPAAASPSPSPATCRTGPSAAATGSGSALPTSRLVPITQLQARSKGRRLGKRSGRCAT